MSRIMTTLSVSGLILSVAPNTASAGENSVDWLNRISRMRRAEQAYQVPVPSSSISVDCTGSIRQNTSGRPHGRTYRKVR